MSELTAQPTIMILVACVLIDYIKADRFVLELAVKHVGRICVPITIVNEVEDIEGPEDLQELGIEIIEPELEDTLEAASRKGSLSMQDWICLLSAKRGGCVCVTSDKRLRRQCEEENVPVMWGLQILTKLADSNWISAEGAMDVATKIHILNPKFITDAILRRLAVKLNVSYKPKSETSDQSPNDGFD